METSSIEKSNNVSVTEKQNTMTNKNNTFQIEKFSDLLVEPSSSDSNNSKKSDDDTSVDSKNNNNNDNNTEEFVVPDGGWTAWLVVIGSFFGLMTSFGFMNSLGSLEAHVETHQLKSYSTSQVGWIFSLFDFICFALGIFIGRLFDFYGAKVLAIIGLFIHIFSIMMISLCTEFYQFILALGIASGIGAGLLSSPLMAVISLYFNEKRGIATGLANCGGAVGAMIFPLMQRSLFKKVGFPWTIRIVGFVCLACLSITLILVKEPKRNIKREPLSFKSLIIKAFDFSAFKDLRYTFIVFGAVFSEIALLSALTYISSYAIAVGYSESNSFIMVTILNGCGVVGSIGSGYLSDYIGRFNTIILTLIVGVITIFVIWLPFGHIHPVLYIFCALFGIPTSSIFSLLPVCIGQICKPEDYGKRYGTMFFFCSLGVLAGIPISGAILGNGDNKHYDAYVGFVGAMMTVSLIFYCLARWKSAGFNFKKF